MDGKTVVITGATSGIGEVAALRLATIGARIVVVARDRARGRATLAKLDAAAPGRGHTAHYGDFLSLAEVARVGAEIAAAQPRIDVLVNNAGAIFSRRGVTAEGLERTFALNHMAYVVLTRALMDRIVASAASSMPARVINTASNAHRKGKLDFADLQLAKSYSPSRAYGTSKLANILFTRELARRLVGRGVTANSFSPGFVATRFGNQAGGLVGIYLRVAKLFAGTQEQGAETLVWLASSPDVAATSGEYFYRCQRGTLTAGAQDDALARRLWDVSEEIAAKAGA
ncbi:MAG TPA: SDR family oxidoreductase [Xanthobacteraceae bacterium]|nr:SDR family oxidoreductase [Xanthobacteraceae bacterium]